MSPNLPVPVKEKLWTRPFALLMLQNLVFWVAINMFAATLPGYVISIGGTAAQTGIMVGVFSYAALLFRPFSGILLDQWNRHRVLLAGTFMVMVITFAYNFLPFLAGLIILRFLHGIGFSAFSTASSTLAADIIPEKRMSEGLGVFGLSNTLSMAIGPSLGLAVAARSYNLMFYLISGLMVISLILVFFMDGRQKNVTHRHLEIHSVASAELDAKQVRKPDLKNIFKSMFEKSALYPSAVAFFMLIAVGSIMTFLPLYGVERGFSNIGLFFTVYAGALIAARFLTGRLADTHGSNIVFIPSALLAIASTVVLAYARTETALLLAAVLYGAGTGLAFPILSAILIRLAPPERRGAANATYFAVIDIAVGSGSIAMGIVSQKWGFFVFFVVLAVVFAISLAFYLIFLSQLERQSHERTRIEYCESAETHQNPFN